MPSEEAGYTYAVEPTAIDRLLANEEESIYRPSVQKYEGRLPANSGHPEVEVHGTIFEHVIC
jgi:hypothetical protein